MMRRWLILIQLIVWACTANAQDTLSVLFLGNSYTSVNNLSQLVRDVSSAAGKTLIIDSNTPGGYTISGHVNDATSLAKISQGVWDYIVIQEQSQIPTIDYYRYNDMYPALTELKALAEQYNPCVKLITYMTWGRRFGGQQCDQGNVNCSPVFVDFNHMQDSLTSAYTQISDSLSIQCAPVGVSWQNVLNDTNLVLHSNDNSHPALEGSYLAALTIFSCIWKIPSYGNSYTAGLSTDIVQYFQDKSDATVFGHSIDWNLMINKPVADFSYNQLDNSVLFMNLSSSEAGAVLEYLWDFGDGETSDLINPTHVYLSEGFYNVKLYANDCLFSDTTFQDVVIETLGMANFNRDFATIDPNPCTDMITIQLESQNEVVEYFVFDILGKIQDSGVIESTAITLDSSGWPDGVYFLQLGSGENKKFKLIKQ